METVTTSRRNFVVGGLVGVAGLGVAGCGGSAGSGTVTTPPETPVVAKPLVESEVSEWETLVGSTFLIAGEAGSIPSTLVTLERAAPDLNRPTTLARHQPFFAYFEMDLRLVPEGGKTYRLTSAKRGAFDLFLGKPSEIRGKGVLLAVLA